MFTKIITQFVITTGVVFFVYLMCIQVVTLSLFWSLFFKHLISASWCHDSTSFGQSFVNFLYHHNVIHDFSHNSVEGRAPLSRKQLILYLNGAICFHLYFPQMIYVRTQTNSSGDHTQRCISWFYLKRVYLRLLYHWLLRSQRALTSQMNGIVIRIIIKLK